MKPRFSTIVGSPVKFPKAIRISPRVIAGRVLSLRPLVDYTILRINVFEMLNDVLLFFFRANKKIFEVSYKTGNPPSAFENPSVFFFGANRIKAFGVYLWRQRRLLENLFVSLLLFTGCAPRPYCIPRFSSRERASMGYYSD